MPYQRQTSSTLTFRRGLIVLGAFLCLGFGSAVSAQDKINVESDTSKTSVTTAPTEGLNFNLTPKFDLSSATGTGAQLDLPLDALGSSVFALDLTSSGCTTNEEGCVRRNDSVNLGLTDTFHRRSKKGLDLTLKPRASMSVTNDRSVKTVGAVIEIGEDLREGSEFENNTWYFFAGADAETLTYNNSVDRITAGQFHLQDRILVGDAEAGLGYRIGDADVSLSYKRREASTEDYKFVEDAAALSFTWKR